METKSIQLGQKCDQCDQLAASIEIVEPNGYPESAAEWDEEVRAIYEEYRDFSSHYLLYSGPGGSNGYVGSAVTENEKNAMIEAFTEPFDMQKIKAQFYDSAGFCGECRKFYCSHHWNSSAYGYGKCPEGHGKSLDPHWSPE